MVRVFFPGQKMPEWLFEVTCRCCGGEAQGAMIFGSLVAVYKKQDIFVVKSIVDCGHGFHVANGLDVVCQGDGVFYDDEPLFGSHLSAMLSGPVSLIGLLISKIKGIVRDE